MLSDLAVARADCIHHWVIEPPNGPFRPGMCKECHRLRSFRNALPGGEWERGSFLFGDEEILSRGDAAGARFLDENASPDELANQPGSVSRAERSRRARPFSIGRADVVAAPADPYFAEGPAA